MSFEKLKASRKTKEDHSFISAEGSSPLGIRTEQVADTAIEKLSSDVQIANVAARLSLDVTDEDGSPSGSNVGIADAAPQQTTNQTDRPATKPVSLQGCHSGLSPALEVRESSRHGRGLYTKSAFSAGSTILSAMPHVSVLSNSSLDEYCSACAGPALANKLKRCPKCKVLWYCTPECQNRDWVWHRRECNALQQWHASAPSPDVAIPGEAVRCLGRILWGSRREGLDSSWVKEIRMLHSNRTTLQPSAFETHTHLAHSVVRYLGVTSPQELAPYGLASAGNLVDLISRFTTNTFTLTTPALTPIGICVSPTVAFANHSCGPNAVIVFPRASNASVQTEPLLHLVALRDIAPGKEVRISYIDTTLPKRYRLSQLKEVYSFTCQCRLCAQAQSADPREAMWCPKRCGGVCPYPTEENARTHCAKCGAQVGDADAILDALRIGQEALDKASSLQFKDPAKAKQLTAKVIPILTSAGVTPSSHPLLAMNRLYQELLVASLASSLAQDDLDETVRTAAAYSAGLQNLLPKGHPVRAVALAELGKLLAVDEPAPEAAPPGVSETAAAGRFPPSGPARVRLAYEALVKAHEEVLVGFGKAGGGGQVGSEVREAIVRLERELGVWTTGVRNVLEDALSGRAVGPPSR